MRQSVLAGALAWMVFGGSGAGWNAALGAQQQGTAPQANPPASPQQQAIPDAPRPQTTLGPVAPGIGTTASSSGVDDQPADPNQPAVGTSLPSSPRPAADIGDEGPPPQLPAAGQGTQAIQTLYLRTNFVEVPFTVKDNKGRLVPGITWREVRIYENGLRQRPAVFTVDPVPLSVALVIDQSVPYDTMTKVNNSLGALQGAFTAYDEVALFTYNNIIHQPTQFTGGQSPRLTQALERSKTGGREVTYADTTGPLSQNINVNDGAMASQMPLVNPSHGTSQSSIQNVPKDVHPLNDAILAAAQSLTKAERGRRRIIYVISDGKEYGSVAKTKDVIRYLQTNKIEVYATLVGDASVEGLGFLDRFHIPLSMRDNILPVYTSATGGGSYAEYRTRGIEASFQKIAEQVRTQYTIGFYSSEPFVDAKYRTLEVKILRPNLDVIAKKGYYPSAEDTRRSIRPVAATPATP